MKRIASSLTRQVETVTFLSLSRSLAYAYLSFCMPSITAVVAQHFWLQSFLFIVVLYHTVFCYQCYE